jgi:peptidoglycan DL-endopeptidase LytF
MSKRNTIIAAVLINAALLTLLFVTAASHENEYYAKSHVPSIEKEEKVVEIAAVSEKPVEIPALPQAQQLVQVAAPVQIAATTEEKIVHALPEVAVENKPAQPVAVTALAPVAAPKLKEVVVKKGDSLDKIARANKVALEEIVKVNQLPNSFLRVGQILKIPEALASTKEAKAQPKEESQSQFYIVKVGDNPWTIAMKHHMKVEELLKMNKMDKEKAKRLKPGDKLRVR